MLLVRDTVTDNAEGDPKKSVFKIYTRICIVCMMHEYDVLLKNVKKN